MATKTKKKSGPKPKEFGQKRSPVSVMLSNSTIVKYGGMDGMRLAIQQQFEKNEAV